MKRVSLGLLSLLSCTLMVASASALTSTKSDTEKEPKIPKFSVDYMDKSVKPSVDFYSYACGNWIKNNPVPADKARWSGFEST